MNIKKTTHLNPYTKKNRYYNNADDKPENFFFQTIPSFMSSLYGRKKRQPENKNDWFVQETPVSLSIEPVITWIGHASFLIQVAGMNILTDPIFGDASIFFPRILAPGIAVDQLPPINYVLLSHNHRDHCDLKSLHALKKLHPSLIILVPQGDKQWLEKKGLGLVIEHTWWQAHTHETNNGPMVFTFLPAHHWSAQGFFDRNKSLWGSWMISVKENHVYFAGDSAYSSHYHQIADQFPLRATALMPIAPGESLPWMRKSHMDAQQAVQAFIDLKADRFIPMHWGTFHFGLDTFSGPIDRLNTAWNAAHALREHKKLIIPKVGQRIIV